VGKIVTRITIEQLPGLNHLARYGFNLFVRGAVRGQSVIERIWRDATSPRLVSAQTLPDEDFLALFGIKEVSAALEQADLVTAKSNLLTYYGRRVTPAWPAPPRTITDLRLNLETLSQEDLIVVANSILAYEFYTTAIRPRITTEGKIDWHFNPTSSREWLLRLNRHQWWPVLGLAYAQTGDERYATAFVAQMLDWITTNLPPQRRNEKSSTWRLMEAGMRMRVSWIPSFALFYESPTFTDEAKLLMLRSIYDHAQFLSHFKTNRNHLLRESNGLAYVSVYFPELKEAKRWQQIALTRLDQELSKQINQDGSHIEVSTGYQWVVTDEFEKTYDLLQTNNLSLPRENLAAWLEKMYQVLAYLVRPDGTFPEVNDGFIRWQYTRLVQAGKKFDRDDFIYIGTAGKQGSAPKYGSVEIRDAGWYVMRSDWTRDARYLLFDAGPYGGPHGHEDKLSIELFAFSQPFIVDSGSYTYEKTDRFRTYFVGSQGHNTILVDGQSQIRRWQHENLSPKSALGDYAFWINRPEFDYVAATYSDGYSLFSLKKPKDPAIINDVIHTRRILFVKPDYWVMVDELHASKLHNYQLLFHVPPEIVVRSGPDNRVILETVPGAPRLHLIAADSQNIKVRWLAGSEDPIQGWYSEDHHYKTPSTVVIFERENSKSIILTTLLYPCSAGEMADEVSIDGLEVPGGKGLGFVVATHYGRDYLMFSQGEGLKHFGPYQSTGTVAGVRTDNNGDVKAQFEGQVG
jgi:hypothetical protein